MGNLSIFKGQSNIRTVPNVFSFFLLYFQYFLYYLYDQATTHNPNKEPSIFLWMSWLGEIVKSGVRQYRASRFFNQWLDWGKLANLEFSNSQTTNYCIFRDNLQVKTPVTAKNNWVDTGKGRGQLYLGWDCFYSLEFISRRCNLSVMYYNAVQYCTQYRLNNTNYTLNTSHYITHTVHYTLHTTHYILCTTYHRLNATHYTLH